MSELPASIVITVALLTVFLVFATALTYAVPDYFTRTRLLMTGFFIFIVATLTVSFWHHTLATLPFSIPAFVAGAAVGHLFGVRAAEQRLKAEGIVHYMQHFAHVHVSIRHFTWWSLINFYSIIGALGLINLVGLTTVIYEQSRPLAIMTTTAGAFLLGTIIPYLIHLWRIRPTHATSSTRSDT